MRGCDSRTPLSKRKPLNCLYLATARKVEALNRPPAGPRFSYDHRFLTLGPKP